MGEDQRTARVEQRQLTQLESELAQLRSEVSGQIRLLDGALSEHSTALDRLDNSLVMPDCQNRGANGPLTPFHGNRNEDFVQYIKQFELICDANNYAAEKRAQILGSYLRDKAFFIYDSLPQATKADYSLLKAALNDKFQTADYRRYAHQKFQSRKQLPTESVPDYACDAHKLGLSALPDVDPDQRDALIREKLIAGLLPHFKELIVYSNLATFYEAMSLAERLEGLQASKADNSAKNVLLLESISDRLSSLEVQSSRASTTDFRPEMAYVMEAPGRRNNAVGNQGKFQLGNYRQEFRPSGMVCYRCNRTGHMARNCTRNQNMNSIMCRLCNRMGHYARNCQRRGASLGRRLIQNGPNRNFGQRKPEERRPQFPNRTNTSMAMEAEPNPVAQATPCEFIPWKPLNAAMWVVNPPRKSGSVNISTDPITTSDVAQTIVLTGTLPSSNAAKALPALGTPDVLENLTRETEEDKLTLTVESVNANCVIKANRANQVCARSTLASFGKCLTSVCCWWFLVMTSFSFTVALEHEGKYRQTDPMICQAFEGKALWKLPSSLNCPEGNHTVDRTDVPTTFRLYKWNYIQYKSDAWKCVKITEKIDTFTYFFGDENLKRHQKYAEPVSAEECVSMRNYKTSNNQPMVYQGGIYQTTNKLEWHYPGGGINCCHWKQFQVTNCFLYRTHVYKRHGTTDMESTAGEVSKCKYRTGQCVLDNGSFLLWDVKNESFCDLMPWKSANGKMRGTSWLSDDSNLALTFTKKGISYDCSGRALMLSDQGIAVRRRPTSARSRKRRQLTVTELQQLTKIVGKGGIVSSAQLAASLQALEVSWERNMQFSFRHALNNVCHFMRSVIELLKTQVLANPTMAIRALTNQSDIFARSGGNVIEVFPCTQLNQRHYRFRPMNGTCTAQIPIEFTVNNKTASGYLDPVTNIIHRFGVPTDCNLVKQVPVQLGQNNYLYHAATGQISPELNVPEIRILQWNVEPVIDMKATIFHEIIMTHISLNDVFGSLDRQRAILEYIGITDSQSDPREAAENAVAKIMDKGFYGFLHGLTANAFQVWTFIICLYVTVCILIVHCVPMDAIPDALNAGNAVRRFQTLWHRWRSRRQAQQEQVPLRRRHSADNPVAPRPRSARESLVISRFTTAIRDRINRRARHRTLLPTTEIEITAPGPPLEDTSKNDPMTTFQGPPEPKTSANVQPFRVNVIYPVSETTISMMVEGLAVQCMLDTGATLTVISNRLTKTLGLDVYKTERKLTSVTGHELPILGETTISASIAGLPLHGKAMVIEHSPFEIIVGTEFMSQLGNIVINFEKRTIKINRIKMAMKSPAPDKAEPEKSEFRPTVDCDSVAEILKAVKFEPKTYLISPNQTDDATDPILAFVDEISWTENGDILTIGHESPIPVEQLLDGDNISDAGDHSTDKAKTVSVPSVQTSPVKHNVLAETRSDEIH